MIEAAEMLGELAELGKLLFQMFGTGATAEIRKIKERYRNLPSPEVEKQLDDIANGRTT
jgi:hypothetical protein